MFQIFKISYRFYLYMDSEINLPSKITFKEYLNKMENKYIEERKDYFYNLGFISDIYAVLGDIALSVGIFSGDLGNLGPTILMYGESELIRRSTGNSVDECYYKRLP